MHRACLCECGQGCASDRAPPGPSDQVRDGPTLGFYISLFPTAHFLRLQVGLDYMGFFIFP